MEKFMVASDAVALKAAVQSVGDVVSGVTLENHHCQQMVLRATGWSDAYYDGTYVHLEDDDGDVRLVATRHYRSDADPETEYMFSTKVYGNQRLQVDGAHTVISDNSGDDSDAEDESPPGEPKKGKKSTHKKEKGEQLWQGKRKVKKHKNNHRRRAKDLSSSTCSASSSLADVITLSFFRSVCFVFLLD